VDHDKATDAPDARTDPVPVAFSLGGGAIKARWGGGLSASGGLGG